MAVSITIAVVVLILVIANQVRARGVSQADVNQAQEMIAANARILDVRTSQEFESGHIKGATLMPLQQITGRLSELEALKDGPILVYCHSGNRSMAASSLLVKRGFTKVTNLRGGIVAWKNAGRPVA